MPAAYTFSELLRDYLQDAGFTPGRLSQISSVPRKTIQHWIKGDVKRPHTPNDLIALAKALRLTMHQTDSLLTAAGQPILASIAHLTNEPHLHDLLTFWHEALAHPSPPPPFQAIADLPILVGRDHEIQTLAHVLRRKDQVGICCLFGMGGVGKTALAARLAYRLRPHFPDGVLWARVDVTPPLAILGAFAQAFDYDVSSIHDIHSRSQTVRSILAHKRVLIVFDNVRQRDEIELLLPPSGACCVLVTTRQHDLLIGTTGYRMEIQPFTAESGGTQALFTMLLGAERVAREHEMLAEIAELVGHLPLALAISASRLAYDVGWTTAQFAACLRAEQGRLGALEHDMRSVRATFNLSYTPLNEQQRTCLMVISICSGAEADIEAIAAIMEVSVDEALAIVRRLYGLSLIQQGISSHYRIHPLVKAYVLEQSIDPALWRAMATYYLTSLDQNRHHYTAIDRMFDHLIGAFQAALRYGLEEHFVQGVIACSQYFRDRGHSELSIGYLERAAQLAQVRGTVNDQLTICLEQGQLAERSGDLQRAEAIWLVGLSLAHTHNNAAWIASLLISLGEIAGRKGDATVREGYWQEALVQIATLDDHRRASELLRQLGFRMITIGDFRRAADHWRTALAQARAVDDDTLICRLLGHLGTLLYEQGAWDSAMMYAQEGIAIARTHRINWLIARTLGTMSIIAARQQDFVIAESAITEALDLARTGGYRMILGDLLVNQGMIARWSGNYPQAEHAFAEVQKLTSRMQAAWLTCEVGYEWGELDLVREDWDSAASRFAQAWDIADEHQFHVYLAPISYGRARLEAALHHIDEARAWGMKSLRCHQALGHYRTHEVAEWLEQLDDFHTQTVPEPESISP